MKRAFMTVHLLDRFIYGATLARAYILRLALLKISLIWFPNVNLVSNLTPHSFLHSLFFTLYLSTLVFEISSTAKDHHTRLNTLSEHKKIVPM